MSSDSLHERGQAMEDMFFRNRDQQLIEKLKANIAAKEARSAMQLVTGIEDEAVLDRLISQQISAESLGCVSLIPMVAVAWADGVMEDKERKAVLQATEKAGVEPDGPAFQLISGWLDNQPEADLLDAWKAYVGALKETLDSAALSQLKSKVIERARNVAQAAGGILGLGNKISPSEQSVLEELAEAFD